MASGPITPPSFGAKNLGDYRGLGRGPFSSNYRRVIAAKGIAPNVGFFERLAKFTSRSSTWGAWFRHVVKYLGNSRYPFQVYRKGTEVVGVPNQLTLSVAGDWGTGTDEAQHVARQMSSHRPDYTIHLGDVYYVGDREELEEHCLGIRHSSYEPVRWRPGSKGSFALNGNHEMYANGTAYFTEFLPTLGLMDPATGRFSGQETSYYCLKNDYWKVIGLDTGYFSTGFLTVLSFLSSLKWIKWFRKTTWFKPSCRLPDELLEWLRGAAMVDSDGRKRGLVFLSHHQYYSGFDDWYQTPGKQLRKMISPELPVLWFWGHEHRLALYDKFGVKDGIQAFGRCVGHGGMPVSRGVAPDIKDCNCVLYDDRRYPNLENIDVGFNGFIDMRFDGPRLCVEYYDLYNTLLLTECWTVDERGQLRGPEFSTLHSGLTQNDRAYIQAHS